MEQIIIGTVSLLALVGLVLVWSIDRLRKRQYDHFRELEKQNLALRAHLEVARAKMRQLNNRRVF